MKKILSIISLISLMESGTVVATQWQVTSPASSIQTAVNSAAAGDTIVIGSGTYSESISFSKRLVLIGAGSSTIIRPPSGNGITVTNAPNVIIQSLRVTHASSSSGISAIGVSNLLLTGITADSNSLHGVSIGAGSSNITINGGTFNKNGTTRAQGNGGGINLDASTGSAMISNISIQGSITANNNTTSGILAYAANPGDSIKTLSIGSSGSVTFTNNGGAGVILYGNVENATVSGNFTKSSANAGGVLIVGISDLNSAAPVNTMIKRSTFNSGYTLLWPAISLSDLGQSLFGSKTCKYAVTADSNQFNTTVIDTLIWDQVDDGSLGLVTHSHDNPLPVELTSFSATAHGREIELAWHTATEVNNYGFEIERRPLPSPPLSGEGNKGWGRIGFVQGMGTTNSPHTYLYKDETSSAGTYAYRLKQIDRDGRFEYSGTVEVATTLNPGDYTLSQNYPNPFNPSTKIRFTLATDDFVQVKVFDILGEEVESLFSGVAKAGVLNVMEFDGSGRSSGVYFYTLTTKNRHDLRKMLLVK